MQNPEHLSTVPAPILGAAKHAVTAIPPSSSSTLPTGYISQSAAEQRQRQPYRPPRGGDERDHSPDNNLYNDGPTRYPPIPTFQWSASPPPPAPTSFSAAAPQSSNSTRKGKGRGWRLFWSYGGLGDHNWADCRLLLVGRLILSLGLTGTITNVIKICVGRPRPDLIDRCQPVDGSVNAPLHGLSNYAICTQTDMYILNDGFRSFPSGHASLSFAGLGFLAFYLAGKLHLFDKRGHTGKSWLAVGPLVGAALVAVSRTMDYRHHWQDVTTASILGLVVAFFSYRQFYPPLSSASSHRPFSPRIPRDDLALPTHRRESSESRVPLTGGLRPGFPVGPSRGRRPSPPRQYSIPVNAGPVHVPSENDRVHHQNPFEDPASRTPIPRDEEGPIATYAAPRKTAA
ncbi:hypothetical protein FRC01_009695 [Tulasnella sp. 417]|nr:hypothetical protein FRC01_009695 [Tulasnella sp. 417]